MKASLKGWLVVAFGIGLVAVGLVFALPDWRLKLGFEPAPGAVPDLAQQPAAPPANAGNGATSVASAPQAAGETAAGPDATTPDATTPDATTDAPATPTTSGETAATADAAATPDAAGDAAGQTGDAAENATETAAADLAATAGDAADAAASPEAPAFDLVRVDPEGEAVIAGTAQPGAEVELLIDGVVIASAIAGGDGSFVVLASLGRSDRARALQLRHAGESTAAVVAEEAVELVTAAPEAAADAPAATATGESAASVTDAGGAADVAADAEPAQAGLSAPVVILPSEAAADAPLIVAPQAEQVALLQPAATEVVRVVLDRISYAPGGDAVAAGRARPGHAVRAYANAEFVADSPVSASGDWQVTLPRATAETAVLLRFDEVSASGEVTSRLETPFAYDDGAGTVATRQRRIVVQRGDNLWRIAEQHYGAGIRYSVIFGANSGLIRDPDLIYPGQVFAIPEFVATE